MEKIIKKKKKNEYYVNNKYFHDLICKNKELHIICENEDVENDKIKFGKEKQRIMNKIGVIYLRICKGLLQKPNFINYTYDRKDDMTSEACLHMTKYTLSFNTERLNPFSYFTTVATNAFKQSIIKWKRYTTNFQPLEYIEQLHIEDNHYDSDWG